MGKLPAGRKRGFRAEARMRIIAHREKFAFSRIKKYDSTDAVYIISHIEEHVRKVKRELKGNVRLCGGGPIIISLAGLGRIDIYPPAMHPLIIGSGVSLFDNIKPPQS